MAISFVSPSYRAASSDLTIAISPLGLVELADEEFEVHGPRLNRYANLWAWYLGHQWIYRRELGEPQVTFNWSKAFSDFITNFCFGKGVVFQAPAENEAIIPEILREVWEVQNNKENLLWEIGANGGVSGDSFVKVAYEEEYVDPAGNFHPPKVRILPLNSAFCFPEWHPHDRNRLIRFKLKYRFWGCVDPETQALSRDGWKYHHELMPGEEILVLDPWTDEIKWQPVQAVSLYPYKGKMHQWRGRGMDALTTPNHRWLAETGHGRAHTFRWEREVIRSGFRPNQGRLITGGGTPLAFASVPKWSDELVETAAWYITEGWDHESGSIYLGQSVKNPEYVARIRQLAAWWRDQGATFSEYAPNSRGMITWYLGKGVREALWEAAPGKGIEPAFLCSLTASQARLFYETLMDGDGCRTHGDRDTQRWTQLDPQRVEGFQMLCAMLGYHNRYASEKVAIYRSRYTTLQNLQEELVDYDGEVWCPTVEASFWLARRGNTTYWTGNTALEGTRQVFTYTELMTEDSIQEFVNDELIDSRENPIGTIPVVHIANTMVPGSPWGLADIQDITELNRLYNETATLLADIINYYAAPVTVVTGAKQNNLERGPKKVWTVPNENAKIQNLTSDANIPGVIAFLQTIKQGMHEITGVPESALGQAQPVSNTSGVALSIMYQPLMNRFHQKTVQYGAGLKRVNELILRYLALYEPWRFRYDPTLDAELQPGQLDVLDTRDPLTYETTCEFSPPLPIDHLVALNEIQLMMGLGLESKVGALRRLGEAYPHEKLQELYDELVSDAKQAGALDLLKRQIDQLLWELGGPPVGGDPSNPAGASSGGVVSAGGNGVTSAGSPAPPSVMQVDPGKGTEELYNALTTLAAGTKLPQRRAPDTTNPSNPG